jgi:di/tricarboxylate transporter
MGLVLAIVGAAFVLLLSERLRMDVVALLVLGGLALSGLVDTNQALSGFSSPAVVTVWSVFILGGGLARTGVAGALGRQVLRLAGNTEARTIAVIMLTAGLMSAFLNNVGVVALMLPVVMDIARQTGRAPSRLLMPLSFGALLGGLTTLIGTPPNLLVSDVLRDFSLRPFGMFDFTPVGGAVLLGGVAFMALIGRHLLPERDITREAGQPTDLGQIFAFQERLAYLQLPGDSRLAGSSLFASRLGAALGLNVLAILRRDERVLAPDPGQLLRAGDRLVVEGRLDRLEELRGRQNLSLDERRVELGQLVSNEVGFAEAWIAADSGLVGQTLVQSGFRHQFGVNILAIRHDGLASRSALQDRVLQANDCLLIQAAQAQLAILRGLPDFATVEALDPETVESRYELQGQLLSLSIPEGSALAGRSLAESRLGDAFGLTVLGIVRDGRARLAPGPEDLLETDDHLLVEGRPEDLDVLRGLNELEVNRNSPVRLDELESELVGLNGVVLSPQTTLAGRTLRQLHFREKFGLSVLAIWRGGRAYRSNLRDMPLRFGDALLLYGSRSRLMLLGAEPDFLVLLEEAQEPPRRKKAPLAALIMLGVLILAVMGAVPIAIASVVGATLMVLTGCLTMEEAYRHIEWRAVFLIAGMLPLGIAMQQTGAADYLARGVVQVVGPLGPTGLMAGLFLLSALITQVMPTPAVVVLMVPIAISIGLEMSLSPYALAMVVAVAASASSLNPVSHPANSLVMGPGGYRFGDFLKVGIPLIGLTLVIVLILLPLVWPL